MKETATTMVRSCELCNGEAAICCPSDSAFLCWSCDAKADLGDAVSSSSSSSACVSSTHSSDQKKMSDQSSESFPSRNEFSIEVTFPATGLKCKSRSPPVPAKVDLAAEGSPEKKKKM
ncbi:uncharacterized protein LOC115999357 [Ipomoea triloba]|uniref:uncharacterized protein LOC115999357 n=1 Tax=Ipomoea triloba TaxID=35885 RepID=UPI00125E800A|nr:uncharacterized protein LOC115999357 [Ipomoea triloba]